MRKLAFFLIIFLMQGKIAHSQTTSKEFPVLKGPYLGQRPPGRTPQIFAPGIISTGLYTRDIAISNNGNEIYFCVSDASVTAIFETKQTDNRWSEPAIASFSGNGFFDFEPQISPDGNMLFFLSNRPPPKKKPKNGWYYQNIWMMARTETGWSEPQLVDEPVSTDAAEFFPSVTNENVLYFTRSKKNEKARIYRSKFENGRFEEPEIVPIIIPDTALLFNAFISPKEDFLITCAQNIDSTNTDQDYYICFKSPDGQWSKLIKFGPEINTRGDNANSAYVTRDGKYLFFSSSRKSTDCLEIKSGTTLNAIIQSKSKPGNGSSAIYWVDAEIVNEMRPNQF